MQKRHEFLDIITRQLRLPKIAKFFSNLQIFCNKYQKLFLSFFFIISLFGYAKASEYIVENYINSCLFCFNIKKFL